MTALTDRVRNTINRAMAPVAGSMVLRRPGTMVPDGAGGYVTGPPTNHPCVGWLQDYDDLSRLADMRPVTDRKAVVLSNSLSVTPAITDTIIIGAQTFRIRSVSTDPATAGWVLQAYL